MVKSIWAKKEGKLSVSISGCCQTKVKKAVTIQVALLRLHNFSSFRGKIGYKMNHFLP